MPLKIRIIGAVFLPGSRDHVRQPIAVNIAGGHANAIFIVRSVGLLRRELELQLHRLGVEDLNARPRSAFGGHIRPDGKDRHVVELLDALELNVLEQGLREIPPAIAAAGNLQRAVVRRDGLGIELEIIAVVGTHGSRRGQVAVDVILRGEAGRYREDVGHVGAVQPEELGGAVVSDPRECAGRSIGHVRIVEERSWVQDVIELLQLRAVVHVDPVAVSIEPPVSEPPKMLSFV